jgi:hypothetical protein
MTAAYHVGMWWLWIVLGAAAFIALVIALYRARRGWGPRTGPYRDDQAAGKAMAGIAKLRDIGPSGR